MGNDKEVINWEKCGMLEGLSEDEAKECSIFLDNTLHLMKTYERYEPDMKFEYRNALPMARRFYSKIRKVYSKDFLEIADNVFYKGIWLDSINLPIIPAYSYHFNDIVAYSGLDAECEWIEKIVDQEIVRNFIKVVEGQQMTRYRLNRSAKKMYLHHVYISPQVAKTHLGCGFRGAFVE